MMEETRRGMEGALPDYLQQLLNSGVGPEVSDPLPKLNDENRALVAEICETHHLLLELENKLEKNKDERPQINEYLQKVKETKKNNTALIKVKESEMEIEKHLTALIERRKGHLTQKSAKMIKELHSLSDRETKLKERIFQTKQKLELFGLQKNWDQQTTLDFLQDSAQKQDDIMAVTKYAHQDEERIKSLTRAIEKETVAVSDERKALDNAMTHNKSAQLALDKATENLERAHMENQQLAHQWENTIRQITQRDVETQKCAQVLVQTRHDVRERTGAIAEWRHLLATQRNNNLETSRRLTAANQKRDKLKQQLETEDANCQRLTQQLKSCQNEMNKATSGVKSLRAGLTQMKKEMKENNDRLEQAAIFNAALEEKLRAVTQTVLSEEERAAQMEQFLKDEEQELKEVEVQLGVDLQELLLSRQRLEEVKAREKMLTLQVSASKSTIKNLERKSKKQEEEQTRLEKIAFRQDSEGAWLKNRLGRLQGDVSSEEREKMEAKMAEQSRELEEKERSAVSLTTAIREAESNIRRLKKEKEKSEGEKADLINKNKELFVLSHLKEKELLRLRLSNQDKLVENQITKAETERLSEGLVRRTDSVHRSEVRRLDLLKAVKDRELEVAAQKETLCRQLHITEQERHKLRLQLNQKQKKLDVVKNRCDILVSSIVAEVEPEKAQAYYITKFAQEKEELREQRDAVEAKVQQVALENEALENTNLLWTHRTSTLRHNDTAGDHCSAELEEKLRLEEQLKTLQEVLRSKRRQIGELQGDLQEKEQASEEVQQEQQELKDKLEVKQRLLVKMEKQTNSHQESISRLSKQCTKLSKQIRRARSSQEETLEEKDIRLREEKEFSRKMDGMLVEAMERSPALFPLLHKHFLEANLPLPSASLSSQRSSRTSSLSTLSSAASSVRSSSTSSARSTAALSTVTLGLDLPLTPPPNTSSCRSPISSAGSSRSKKKLQ